MYFKCSVAPCGSFIAQPRCIAFPSSQKVTLNSTALEE